MMDDFEEWEREQEAVRKENEALLQRFEQWLAEKGLKPKTINNHRGNVDFFINEYLLNYDPLMRPEDGIFTICDFFEEWFPRKAMWANPTSVKSMTASFKKFYQFLLEQDKVDQESLQELKEEIKFSLPDWMEASEL